MVNCNIANTNAFFASEKDLNPVNKMLLPEKLNIQLFRVSFCKTPNEIFKAIKMLQLTLMDWKHIEIVTAMAMPILYESGTNIVAVAATCKWTAPTCHSKQPHP